MPDDSHLLTVLESLRERGALGETDLVRSIDHADNFVAALPLSARRVIDLGSGGGLPGLVIAVRRPELRLVLTDRRERRMDLLRLACARLDLDGRVDVVTGDVVKLASSPEWAGSFDAVTARAFGEPLWTLRCAEPFLSDGGVVIVSEPPAAETDVRWPPDAVAELGLRPSSTRVPSVALFRRI